MVVYYINKVSDNLHEYAFPIKEGDICMLYDGTVVKTIYVDSEVENDSIWRDFKYIDTKSLRSYHFPTTDSILCAPVGSKHALGNAGLITQLSQECTGEWLSDFLNETSAILSGFVDYWDLGILRRLTGDEDVAEVFEDENALSEFVEDEKVEEVEANDEEDDWEDGFDIPENSDITTRNRYLMQFCYGILSEFQDALTDREKGICNMLLVENTRRKASEEYRITEERVRQIYVKSIKKISEAHKAAMQELDELRKENEELKRRNYLLEKELKGASNLDNVLSLQEIEDTLCYNAKRLLAYPPEELPLSNRTTNILRVAKIEYFKDIPQLTLEEVQKFRNCGRKTITELRDFMAKYSLDFGMTYEDIVLCMSKFVDGDFDPSLFAYQNIRNQMNVKTAVDNVKREDMPEEDDYDEGNIETSGNEVEHVFLDSKGEVEGATTLPICAENRSGMSWSSEEEEQITNYYHQGYSFYAIAKAVGRTEIAIKSRLGQLGVIDYTYGQENKLNEGFAPVSTDDNDEDSEEAEFDGKELADRYYYPVQDSLFWDEKKQVYEIYLADSYELVINHLIFDFDMLNEIEAKAEGMSEDEKEGHFSDYWYDNHINIIARIKLDSEGFELLQFDTGIGIQDIAYKPGEYTYIKIIDEDDGLAKFIDYNGAVFDSPEQIMAITNTEVARHHDFYDAPQHVIKEYIRLGMIEIKRLYKGSMKKVTIFTDSELGYVIKNNSEEIWMLDINHNTIITKSLKEEDSAYPLKVYFRNGVKMNETGMKDVKKRSLVLQTQLIERIKKLQASLKKKKEKIRYERQFKEIVSTLFTFEDGSINSGNTGSNSPE